MGVIRGCCAACGRSCRRPTPGAAAGGGEPAEQVVVEALVTGAAVEAFHDTVLLRLARRRGALTDAPLLLPLFDEPRGSFGDVVSEDHRRPPAPADEGVEVPP